MAQHSAAMHIAQNELTPALLADTLGSLSRDSLLLLALKAARWRSRGLRRGADQIEQVLAQR